MRDAPDKSSAAAPLAYTVDEAAEAARVSRTTLYAAMRDGRLRVAKVGKRTIITAKALGDFLEACEGPTRKRR